MIKLLEVFSDDEIEKLHSGVIHAALLYIKRNLTRIELLVLLTITLFLCSKIPYVNLILSFPISVFIVLFGSILLLRIPIYRSIWIIPALFTIAFVFALFKNITGAEYIGNIIYVLTWIIVVKKIGEI